MRYVKVIEPVQLTNLQGVEYTGEAAAPVFLDMHSFILQRMVDAKFGQTHEGVVAVSQIRNAVNRSKHEGSEYIELETKDWDLLVDVVKTPSNGNFYNTNIAHCLVPFIQGVLNAPSEKPTTDGE